MIKYFRFSYEYVLWGIVYTNLIMLMATIPTYDSDDKKVEKKDGVIDFGDDVGAMAKYINNM